MRNFCPFIKDKCREDCVFYTDLPRRSAESHCQIDGAMVNLEYIGGVIAERASKEEDAADNQK